tara:strand:+ start:270 stop:992 length:723 start_codon:yes stop_codon:yes gene_type:complete
MDMQVGRIGLPRVECQEFAAPVNSYFTRINLIYYSAIKGSRIVTQKRTAMLSDRRIAAHEGKMISSGDGGGIFSFEHLLLWWAWRANDIGEVEADRELETFLTADTIPFQKALWLYGLEIDRRVPLFDGVELVPFRDMIDSEEKEAVLQSSGTRGMNFVNFPRCALVKRSLHPKFFDDEAGRTDRTSKAIEDAELFYTISLLLNCLSGVHCAPSFHTGYVPPNTPFGPFGGEVAQEQCLM